MRPRQQWVRCRFAEGSLWLPSTSCDVAPTAHRPTVPRSPRLALGHTDRPPTPQRPVGEKQPMGRDRTSDPRPKSRWVGFEETPTAYRPHSEGAETADGSDPWVMTEPATRAPSTLWCFPPNTPRDRPPAGAPALGITACRPHGIHFVSQSTLNQRFN